MFNVVELKFNAAEHKYNDVEHTFSDTKLSFHPEEDLLTGGSMAYTRPDGVKVIPLACLKD